MKIESIPIIELIPQRAPFVFVDELVYFDLQECRTVYTVPENGLLNDALSFSAYGMMENIAQTCAVSTGYYNKVIQKDKVRIGLIGSIKNFVVHRYPIIGEKIETSIQIVHQVMSMTLVQAGIYSKDELLASCEMKIAVTE